MMTDLRQAVALALREWSGCGLTIEGETVFCDDQRAPEEVRGKCDCYAGADAVLATVSESIGEDMVEAVEAAMKRYDADMRLGDDADKLRDGLIALIVARSLAARDATLEEAASMFDTEASHATAEGLWIAAEIFTKHAALVRALKGGPARG